MTTKKEIIEFQERGLWDAAEFVSNGRDWCLSEYAEANEALRDGYGDSSVFERRESLRVALASFGKPFPDPWRPVR